MLMSAQSSILQMKYLVRSMISIIQIRRNGLIGLKRMLKKPKCMFNCFSLQLNKIIVQVISFNIFQCLLKTSQAD